MNDWTWVDTLIVWAIIALIFFYPHDAGDKRRASDERTARLRVDRARLEKERAEIEREIARIRAESSPFRRSAPIMAASLDAGKITSDTALDLNK